MILDILLGSLMDVDFDFFLISFQEVQRIVNEHPDDAYAVMNDRVKGSLKVTRAFGAGFLKQVNYLSNYLLTTLKMNMLY